MLIKIWDTATGVSSIHLNILYCISYWYWNWYGLDWPYTGEERLEVSPRGCKLQCYAPRVRGFPPPFFFLFLPYSTLLFYLIKPWLIFCCYNHGYNCPFESYTKKHIYFMWFLAIFFVLRTYTCTPYNQGSKEVRQWPKKSPKLAKSKNNKTILLWGPV